MFRACFGGCLSRLQADSLVAEINSSTDDRLLVVVVVVVVFGDAIKPLVDVVVAVDVVAIVESDSCQLVYLSASVLVWPIACAPLHLQYLVLAKCTNN